MAIIDESVLHRQVGTRQGMNEQLHRLIEAPVCVQVLPHDADTYLGLDGSFALATVDGRDWVLLDAPARSFVLDSAEIVSEIRRRWDVLRGEALPQRQSRELMLKVAEGQWKSER